MNKKIIFSSGGTGGHIFPALGLIGYFLNKDYEVVLVTDARGSKYANKFNKIRKYIIKTDTPTNKNIFKKIISFIVIFFSVIRSIFILRKEKPDLVFGLGGYVSFPISFASKILGIPLVIYENNLIIGRTNKRLLPFAKKILFSTKIFENFPKKYEKKAFYVGNILREEIINYKAIEDAGNKKVFSILILGGSQGAEIFGKVVPPVIKMIKDKGHEIEIYQQCIIDQKETLIKFYNTNKIKNTVFDFHENILDLISLSNLVVSRCGASTTAELVQTLTPFIGIPYPFSVDNHQHLNAKYYESKGCCWVLEQNNFNFKNLYNLLMSIIKDKNKLKNIRQNMKKNVSKNVYQEVEKMIGDILK